MPPSPKRQGQMTVTELRDLFLPPYESLRVDQTEPLDGAHDICSNLKHHYLKEKKNAESKGDAETAAYCQRQSLFFHDEGEACYLSDGIAYTRAREHYYWLHLSLTQPEKETQVVQERLASYTGPKPPR